MVVLGAKIYYDLVTKPKINDSCYYVGCIHSLN